MDYSVVDEMFVNRVCPYMNGGGFEKTASETSDLKVALYLLTG